MMAAPTSQTALTQQLLKLLDERGSATPAPVQLQSQLSPNLHIPGTHSQVMLIQAVFTQISQQTVGKQMLQALAGRDITVRVVDDELYAKLSKQGTDQPNTLTMPASALTDTRRLAAAMVSGLAIELAGVTSKQT